MYNPQVHHRRSIRIKEYDYSKNGMYFITICTKNRECILSDIVGAPAYRCPENITNIKLSYIGKILQKNLENINHVYNNIKLEEYVIMPNHIHFIINIMESGHLWAGAPTRERMITIPKIINSLKTITSKQLGHSIWQRNYYEHIIRNEKELYKIIEYIEYNPINWENDCNYKEN